MPIIDATPKSTTANGYATLARVNEILSQRLYTTEWDAVVDHTADGWQTSSSALAGATSVAVDTGTGTWSVGTEFTFAGHATVYTATSVLSVPGNLSISPSLASSVADNESLDRITLSDKDRAIIYATRLFDRMMTWFGTPTTTEQLLRHPRSGLVDADGRVIDKDTISVILEEALAEMALVLLQGDTFKKPDILGQALKKAKIGPIDVEVDPDKGEEQAIPENIVSLMSELGRLESEARKGSNILRAVRA